MMKIQSFPVILTSLLLVTACSLASSPALEPDATQVATGVQELQQPVIETLVPAETPVPLETVALPAGSAVPDCLDGETSSIGRSIAEGYEFATYEQVMAWFCNGAEFEDILVALETEEQTGTPAGDMLELLAEGFTWDEIWQSIGLTD